MFTQSHLASVQAARLQLIDLGDEKTAATLAWAVQPVPGEWSLTPEQLDAITFNEEQIAAMAKRAAVDAPMSIAPQRQHRWDAEGERCTKCGDKDWFAGPECHGKTVSDPAAALVADLMDRINAMSEQLGDAAPDPRALMAKVNAWLEQREQQVQAPPTGREVERTAPARIYLNVSDSAEHFDMPFPKDPHGDEVTWSEDKALDCCVGYVRADTHAELAARFHRAEGLVNRLIDERDSVRGCLNQWIEYGGKINAALGLEVFRPEQQLTEIKRLRADAKYPEIPDGWKLVPAHDPLYSTRRDAERYRWIRRQTWDSSAMCVVSAPKESLRLGTYCPRLDSLDEYIDAALATGKGKQS